MPVVPSNYANVIGALGVALLLAAFVLNLAKRLTTTAPTYSVLNLVGAGLACYSSYLIDFLPFVVLEGVWALAALGALVRTLATGSGHAAD
ncbi:MAG TPA: hypothetical protein VG840_09550 [Casimicrobiaceae bacterium]|jgi:hypothetical protein|nr:hypothetical protein [Casimicrobiaceae bacterium]